MQRCIRGRRGQRASADSACGLDDRRLPGGGPRYCLAGCWNVARENSSSESIPSWFVSSWSKIRLAGLSAAPAVALVAVDGLVPRGAIVLSVADAGAGADVSVQRDHLSRLRDPRRHAAL